MKKFKSWGEEEVFYFPSGDEKVTIQYSKISKGFKAKCEFEDNNFEAVSQNPSGLEQMIFRCIWSYQQNSK